MFLQLRRIYYDFSSTGKRFMSISNTTPHQTKLDVSPPICRMKNYLDRDAFRKSVTILAARVSATKTGLVLKSEVMRGYLLNLPKIRSVVVDPSDPSGDRLVLLRVLDEVELSPESMEFLKTESDGLVTYTLALDYNYWTADEILQAILPEELCKGSPTGFAITGHIAHLNLNDEYLPFKHVIGQIILDKNKHIRTVVNKLGTIDNEFRFFEMELLAGEADYIVEHYESNCRFTFDFTRVYWNSRLHTEHNRLVQLFNPHDVIADVFAGVGPFAVPAANKGCGVFANDLNPNSAKYLFKNVQDNRVTELVRVSCEDGRNFIPDVALRLYDDPFAPYTGPKPSRTKEKEERRYLQKRTAQAPPIDSADFTHALSANLSPRKRIDHFVLNLPDSAIQFLDAFRGILSSTKRNFRSIYQSMPMVHCYCFTRELEPEKAEADIRKRVEEKLGYSVDEDVHVHLVRSVAPNKNMYCISFRLPAEVAFA